ncbi:hypothetical protein P9112_009480 [Eukaryota sp. TZLM1-RC]
MRTPRELKGLVREARSATPLTSINPDRSTPTTSAEADLRRKYAKLKALADDDQQLVVQLRQQLNSKTNELVECQSTLRSLRRTYEDLSIRSAADRTQLENVTAELRDLRREASTESSRTYNSTKLQEHVDELRDRLLKTETERDDALQQLKTLQSTSSDSKNRNKLQDISLRQLTSQHNRVTAEKENLAKQIKFLKQELSKVKNDSSNMEQQLNNALTERESFKKSNEVLRNDLMNMEQDYYEVSQELRQAKQESSALNRSINDVEAQNMTLIDQINDLQSDAHSRTTMVAKDWESRCVKEREDHFKELEEIRGKFEQDIKNLEGENFELRNRIEELSVQNERHLEANLLIKHELQEEKGILADQKQSLIDGHVMECNALHDQIKTLNQSNVELEGKLMMEKKAFEALSVRFDRIEKENQELKLRLGHLESFSEEKSTDFNEKMSKLVEERDSAKSELLSTKKEVEKAKKSFRNEVGRLSNALHEANSRIDELNNEIKKLNESEILQKMKECGSNLAGKTLTLQKNVDSLKTDLSCLCCFKLYTEPTLLSCGHSFCLDCIRNMEDGCVECGGDVTANVRFDCMERLLSKFAFINQSSDGLAEKLEDLEGVLSRMS